ncbi:hypothetical protein KAH49_22445, partial [Providencia rettgeri]|uniref:hypothetical protein n=1 Tax=Providencia rettgeri TaxID=587 RepID=UPI001B37310C
MQIKIINVKDMVLNLDNRFVKWFSDVISGNEINVLKRAIKLNERYEKINILLVLLMWIFFLFTEIRKNKNKNNTTQN